MSAGILDGFQTIIPTAAAVLSEKRQILRLTQQEVANRAKITLRQYQRLESGERNILTSSFGLACRVIEALDFAKEKNTSCVMCHEENELKKQQKTAIITLDNSDLITSYEEKPKEPKGNLAVPPFYCYRACDVKRIQEALNNGCGYDAPGSFAAWLSKQTPMHAYIMPGKRYDIGDINSYEYVKSVFSK